MTQQIIHRTRNVRQLRYKHAPSVDPTSAIVLYRKVRELVYWPKRADNIKKKNAKFNQTLINYIQISPDRVFIRSKNMPVSAQIL